MTDLLLSELLVLVLLLPVLLRPFSKLLKKGFALPILPFIGFFVCICIILGQGIVLSFVIVTALTLLVCISEIIRFTAFRQGVLNDFYGILSILLRIVLLVLFSGTVYLCFRFAPEAQYKPEHPLIVQPIVLAENPDNPVRGMLIERQSGAHKKILAVVAEAFPQENRAGTLAVMLADQGYTVLEITHLKKQDSIPRLTLYKALVPLIGKREPFLTKETNPQTAAFFSEFILKTVQCYGQNKRLFFYTEGIYTKLTAQFCTDNAGFFAGVFFNLSEDEPLPDAPEGWLSVVNAVEKTPVHDVQADTQSASDVQNGTPIEAESDSKTSFAMSHEGTSISDRDTATMTNGDWQRPFCAYIQPRSELTGFGSLRADDSAMAELLGSGRSIGRKDKAASAAAFDRYVLSF